jgi:hypothetical protein
MFTHLSLRKNLFKNKKVVSTVQNRNMNFASTQYAEKIASVRTCGYVQPDFKDLREKTVNYIDKFDAQSWYAKPIQTLLNGKPLTGNDDKTLKTTDAFNKENGAMIHSSLPTLSQVITHLETFQPKKDYREQMRKIEKVLLSNEFASQLVGNQAMDFHKQDGITEIEEAHLANIVERGLNDLLLADEESGKVVISRKPALVGAVSNFSNFLDLFRKTLRNIELGVPVAVLSRSNTTQHVFRWVTILSDLMKEHGVDAGMLTYISCDVATQREIMKRFPDSPLYFTGSRQVAKLIKEVCPKLMASTGGPNTLVSTVLNDKIAEAIRLSCLIENSGQCTALRHVVIPPKKDLEETVIKMFDQVTTTPTAKHSLEVSEFASIIEGAPFSVSEGYHKHPTKPVAYKIGTEGLPKGEIDEHWRQVYLDFTQATMNSESISQLSAWLNTNQPISLAVNADTYTEAYDIARQLFEKTALVVYTVGSTENPSLTCQARPQDGEVFGEFPPRKQMSEFSKFPVIVPSSTPGYNSSYSKEYLSLSNMPSHSNQHTSALIQEIDSTLLKSYARILADYLIDSLQVNPKKGFGNRTALWGLQNVPQGRTSIIRANDVAKFDVLAVHLLPFLMTSSHSQIQVSVDPANKKVIKKLDALKIQYKTHSNEQFSSAANDDSSVWGIIHINNTPDNFDYPLVGHFVSTLLPLGHIKCTKTNDNDFVEALTKSQKWLQIRS